MANVATLRVASSSSDALLTPEEAAHYLKISPKTLKNWGTAKRLSYVKVGNRRRYEKSVLDAYIATRRVEAVNPF